ncbi:hypothetical protein, conserved [Trypanosoma brucei gambiense DAL972]|uniref:RING-type domain-containing protein n=1 Tax=Trypanosoma brucei gambiense (strain MHOM/CI/86/DAL972) TaxID=679716 RepID=D0A688_TRYB9|nr:hypothetical protein, conserved [Trypanosoma brucei gambiense DAL972]CBH17189.1 hypothetical protein, conserved [Trypanosoma brucei gambiense DAL972]|eukprot:XP_011779453.1 hypothetical protein, conserved [Trypanosoma brucei gambiense DAL972]
MCFLFFFPLFFPYAEHERGWPLSARQGCLPMETEGVVQYRLLGSHPAASGRYHSFGFSGDVVTVTTLTQDIVKQHQINLTKYKLEIQRVISAGNDSQEGQTPSTVADVYVPLQSNDVLHSYDRVIVNVSRRHYLDGVVEAAQDEKKAREERLQHVEGMLHEHEATTVTGTVSSSGPVGTGKRVEVRDPHTLKRVTAVSGKAFPVLPWLLNRTSVEGLALPTPKKGICVLCELESFDEVMLECCRFYACASCLDLAKNMLTKETTCAVCGDVPGEKGSKGSLRPNAVAAVKRERSESCVSGASTAAPHVFSQFSSASGDGRGGSRATSISGTQSRVYRTTAMVSALERELNTNMAHILSLLDIPDPLTAEAKENRRMSNLFVRNLSK